MYRNPLANIEPLQPKKTFRIFTSKASAACWLRDPKHAAKVISVRHWKDGKVAVNYYGCVKSRRHYTLEPARYLSAALVENERITAEQARAQA